MNSLTARMNLGSFCHLMIFSHSSQDSFLCFIFAIYKIKRKAYI